MDEKLKERLLKLQALAERGIGGEKVTAEKKLRKMLEANGLTEEDLVGDTVNYYLFSYQGQHQRRLLCQCIYKVLGANNSTLYRSKGTRNKLGVYCTPAQKMEIDLDYEFYKNLLDSELDIFLTAFIDKQNIYPEDVPVQHIDKGDLTPEQLEELSKLHSYQDGITKRTRSLMIEESKE